MNKIAVYLNRHLTGNVFDKDSILDAYSTDRSLLKVKPRLVALPETTADIRKLVRFAAQLSEKKYDLPIAVRGSGLSATGADLSSGLVISMEKLNHIRELDAHDRLVHVQAGISLGKLNAVLAPHGLVLPINADPRETIGSLISNAPHDGYSKRYGGIMNYVDRLEVILSSGDLIQTSRLSTSRLYAKKSQKSFEGEVYEKLDELLIKHDETVANLPAPSCAGYPGLKHVRRNHGHVFDLMPTFFGAEGSLGVISEVILRLEVLPHRSHRLLAVFNNLKTANEFITKVEKLNPLSVELYDSTIFKEVDDFGKKPELLTKKFDDDSLVVLISFNDKSGKSRRKVKKCLRFLPKSAYVVSETVKNSLDFDDFAGAISSYLNDTGNHERPPLLNDFYVPREKLGEFMDDLKPLAKLHKKSLHLYGCYSTGIYSLRPEFDLKKVDERRTALTLLRDLDELLKKHGGALAGGAPEGRLKAMVLYPDMDKKEKKLYSETKKIFDKANIFAPNTKTNFDIKDTVKHLRTEPLEGLVVC